MLNVIDTESGIGFALSDDATSTTATTRQIVAEAASAADEFLAQRISESEKWRLDYAPHLAELTRVTSVPGRTAVSVARAGLDSMGRNVVITRDGRNSPIGAGFAHLPPRYAIGVEEIVGGSAPVTELRVPYRGSVLSGEALRNQLARWTTAGIVEPSFTDAIERVMVHPEWLSLPGRRIALIGAASEMGPLTPLTRWGAHVLALDIPRPELWERICETAHNGAGTVTIPFRPDRGFGVDVTTELPELRAWLDRAAGDDALVVGMYAYADRAQHLKLTAAVDVLYADLSVDRPDTGIAYLATPTDAFAVEGDVAMFARHAYRNRRFARLGRALTAGRAFKPAYEAIPPVGRAHLSDTIVVQQGPTYAVAKRLQRWRGIVAADERRSLSFNVAPPSWTRSVTRNRTLAAAYHGARHFGIEIFEPDTAATLMAALLVHDLNRPAPVHAYPEQLFSHQAAHGGLWRTGYESRSVLTIAALIGLPATM